MDDAKVPKNRWIEGLNSPLSKSPNPTNNVPNMPPGPHLTDFLAALLSFSSACHGRDFLSITVVTTFCPKRGASHEVSRSWQFRHGHDVSPVTAVTTFCQDCHQSSPVTAVTLLSCNVSFIFLTLSFVSSSSFQLDSLWHVPLSYKHYAKHINFTIKTWFIGWK